MTCSSKKDRPVNRVLVVHGNMAYGGTDAYLIDAVGALLEEGLRVSVLFTNNDIPLQLREKLEITAAEILFESFSVSHPDAKFYNKRFAQLLNKIRPDVVLFNRGGGLGWSKYSDLIVTARLKRVSRIVAVEHCHPCPFPVVPGRPFYTRRKQLHCWLQAQCLDAIVCMNKAARNTLTAGGYHYPSKRLHVIYNGVDTKKFQYDPVLRERYRNSLGAKAKTVVLYCGRLSFEKGPDILLDAWKLIPTQDREQLLLVIVGDGPNEASLSAEVEQGQMGASVQFLGFRDDIVGYLCGCDILVLPSREESFGLSLAEAMAVGRYVIATRVGGVPELVSRRDVGQLVEPGVPEQLAEAILASAKDSDNRRTVGSEAQRHVRENFSLERMKTETVDVVLGRLR